MNIKKHNKNKITIVWAATVHFLCSGRKECVPALRHTVLGHSATTRRGRGQGSARKSIVFFVGSY